MNNTQTTIYIESKLDGKKYCKDNGHFTKHLRKNNISYQQYYEKYITGIEEKCSHCENPKSFYQSNESYATTCGNVICIGKEISLTKQNWTEEQKKTDSLNKKIALSTRTEEYYKERRDKVEKTSLERYGTSYPTKSIEFKNKSKNTKLEKYGNEHYSGWEKSSKKNRNKTIDEQNDINNKRRKTNIELSGVGCSFLKPDSIKNSRKGNSFGKEYVFPSGKIVGIRGHENLALDKLFKDGYKEDELLIHNKLEKYELPVFKYVNFNKHTSEYYPDIYISKENKIIEVKSQWWWDGYGEEKYKGRLINNMRKMESVKNANHLYEVWIFDKNKLIEIIKHE